jgi:hypothetical protein
MKPADRIKKLINKSDVTTDSEADKRILGDALEHLEKLKQQKSAGTGPNIWRTIMRAKVSKLATAAAIFIAFGIGFSTGRWSKPTQLAPPSSDVTGYTSAIPVYPTAPKAEDSFWRQKALAAMQPRPYAQTQTTKTSLLNTYKQYLKEKHYD